MAKGGANVRFRPVAQNKLGVGWMAFDLFDVAGEWLDLLRARRLIIPLGVGIAAGLGVFYLGGQDPASAAVAFAIGIVGLVVGVIWQIAGGGRSGSA